MGVLRAAILPATAFLGYRHPRCAVPCVMKGEHVTPSQAVDFLTLLQSLKVQQM